MSLTYYGSKGEILSKYETPTEIFEESNRQNGILVEPIEFEIFLGDIVDEVHIISITKNIRNTPLRLNQSTKFTRKQMDNIGLKHFNKQNGIEGFELSLLIKINKGNKKFVSQEVSCKFTHGMWKSYFPSGCEKLLYIAIYNNILERHESSRLKIEEFKRK